MRVVITGATGFVGPFLCEHLLASGDDVTTLSSGMDRALPAAVKALDIDIRDHASVTRVLREVQPDGIYHLAAISSIAAAAANPRLTFEINVGGTFNILEAATHCARRPRILVISSSHVYSDAVDDVGETTAVAPGNPYGVTKAMAELAVGLVANCDCVIARPFNHSGPGQSPDFVLASFASQIVEMECGRRAPVLRVGDLDVERDFLDVRDVVRAYRLLIEHGKRGEAYNIACGTPRALARVVDVFRTLTSVAFTVEVDRALRRPGQRRRIAATASKIKAATNWTPTIPLSQTLNDMLNFSRQQEASRSLAQQAP